MVKKKSGLIINVSSSGGLKYLFNVAYGVGKAGCDRMAADCGLELRSSGVAMISLWPGPVKTEFIQDNVHKDEKMVKIFEKGETIEFAGIVCAYLAAETNIMSRSGKIIMTADVANEYGFNDIDGKSPIDLRQIRSLIAYAGYPGLAAWMPEFLRVPLWLMHFGSYNF